LFLSRTTTDETGSARESVEQFPEGDWSPAERHPDGDIAALDDNGRSSFQQ
jgi:hypothetical protein